MQPVVRVSILRCPPDKFAEMRQMMNDLEAVLRPGIEAMRGLDIVWTVTDDPASALPHDRIDGRFLRAHIKDWRQNFYLCGPDDMVKQLRGTLKELGASVENVTWEK